MCKDEYQYVCNKCPFHLQHANGIGSPRDVTTAGKCDTPPTASGDYWPLL